MMSLTIAAAPDQLSMETVNMITLNSSLQEFKQV